MVKYIKCPRCELNYIDAEQQEYCDVCLAEMRGSKLKFADLDEDDEIEKTEICPVCGINYMRYGEKMCEDCKKNSEYEEDEEIDPEQDDEWRNYLDDDADDLPLEEEPLGLADEFASEFADDFEDDEELEEESAEEFEELDYEDDLGDFDEDDEEEDDEEDVDEDF